MMNHPTKLISTLILTLFIVIPGLRAGEIHNAAASGDLNKVKALLEADLTLLESKDKDGNTPLISACWGPPSNTPQIEVADFLIDKGANIHARNNNGATPLYFACKNLELAQHLIDKGADVNVQAYGGYTPLMQATYSGNLKLVKLLADHGAELNARGQQGTVLHQIIINKTASNTAMVKLLVENGAKLQEYCYGNTELHLAVLLGSSDMVQTLINLGADVNAVNDYGYTPLYYAAMHGQLSKADMLIAAGANKSTIVESNYDKAPQLTKKLKNGEAYIWYLGGNETPQIGYAVKTSENLLIFNPSDINDSSKAGLSNGYLNPKELAGQNITALISYQGYQGRFGTSISEFAKQLPGANFVLNFKPSADSTFNTYIPQYKFVNPHESFSIGNIQVHTIPAMQKAWFGGEGLGYLVEVDGLKIFHAGLHASGNKASDIEQYRREIDFLKPFGPIDIAILPVNGRHLSGIEYEPYLYLLEHLSPKAVYLIGNDIVNEEYRKCPEVLRASKVPVYYPDGGIAVGQRFHFLRD